LNELKVKRKTNKFGNYGKKKQTEKNGSCSKKKNLFEWNMDWFCANLFKFTWNTSSKDNIISIQIFHLTKRYSDDGCKNASWCDKRVQTHTHWGTWIRNSNLSLMSTWAQINIHSRFSIVNIFYNWHFWILLENLSYISFSQNDPLIF